IAYTMEVFPDASPDDTKKRLDEIAKKKSTGRLYEQLFIRHWDSWKDGRRSHLFVAPSDGGKSVDLTKGMDTDIPPKPFGGPSDIAFPPDSKPIVFPARNAGWIFTAAAIKSFMERRYNIPPQQQAYLDKVIASRRSEHDKDFERTRAANKIVQA